MPPTISAEIDTLTTDDDGGKREHGMVDNRRRKKLNSACIVQTKQKSYITAACNAIVK